jgi:choline dehydrogenase-like flavoprotein
MMTVELLPADEHNQRTINQSHPPNWQNPPGGDYDLVVIGGGPAALVAALTAAAGGHRVAMTERRLTGGTCVNFGCTPSKALADQAAGRYSQHGERPEMMIIRLPSQQTFFFHDGRPCGPHDIKRDPMHNLTLLSKPRSNLRVFLTGDQSRLTHTSRIKRDLCSRALRAPGN